jgi:DNA polymerase III delta prime subunit
MFSTIGHQKQKDFLQQLLETKRYSHAYLFTGPSEIGKRTLAVEFAARLLEIDPLKDLKQIQHPDLIQVDASSLAIADMRELLATLSLAPFSAEQKIVIIDNFEQASANVSNALLKTIEEPNPTTMIILIAENYKALLPTVISRTQRVHFAALSDAEMKTAVPDAKNVHELNGRIGRALRMANDAEYAEQFHTALAQLSEIKRTVPAERLLAIKKLADLETEELMQTIRFWVEAEQAALPEHPQNYPNLNAFAAALSGLRRNFNTKLVLQKIMLKLIA